MAYILPDSLPSPAMDRELDAALQRAFVGITGMPGKLVRPRWQPEPPNLPDFSLTWAAFGVTDTDSDLLAFLRQVDAETQELQRDQWFTTLASFYGAEGQASAERWRDGLQIQQNRAELLSLGIKVTEVGKVRRVPSLVKGLWQDRRDVAVVMRRRYTRIYRVSSVASATVGLDNELYVTPINVTP